MKIKNWLSYSFCSIIMFNSIVVFLMYWSDTYSIAHPKRTEFYTEPNTRISKVDYILENKTLYDSFIFGSSRVTAINPLKITNGKYYNMSYSEGIPHEHLLNIRLFLKNGVKIKNLLIGLDEFSYQVSFKKHQQQGLTKLHYLATETNKLIYFKENFMRMPLGEDRRHFEKMLTQSKIFFELDVSNQKNYYLKKSNKNKRYYHTKKHLTNEVFNKPTLYNGNVINDTIDDIQEIKNICLKNNINCKFFINPVHKTTYRYVDKELLKEFKKKLQYITGYYDFTLPSIISKSNYYWIETSHYRDIVGDMIIDYIYNKNTDSLLSPLQKKHDIFMPFL